MYRILKKKIWISTCKSLPTIVFSFSFNKTVLRPNSLKSDSQSMRYRVSASPLKNIHIMTVLCETSFFWQASYYSKPVNGRVKLISFQAEFILWKNEISKHTCHTSLFIIAFWMGIPACIYAEWWAIFLM